MVAFMLSTCKWSKKAHTSYDQPDWKSREIFRMKESCGAFPPPQYRQVKIGKKWLQNRKDIKAEQYRSIVKQTMLLAAARMEARIFKRTKMKNGELRDPNMTDMKV